MKYKIILNVPNQGHPTEITITQEQLDNLEPHLNSKKIIKIDNAYYNLAYIVQIIPDADASRLENMRTLKLEETSQNTQHEKNREALAKMRETLKEKGVFKK